MTNAAATAEKMTIGTALAEEFRAEGATTRRVLERVPADKLGWRPHPKSLTLGQLALHIAAAPGRLVPVIQKTEHEINPGSLQFPEPATTGEILAAFDQSVKDSGTYLDGLTDAQAHAAFTLRANGKTIFTRPRVSVVRMIMFSHIFHHRGQLSVYLRQLDVPVPSIYGPSGDENPFA